MDPNNPEINPEIGELLTARDAIESQRNVLGTAVDSVIDQINERLVVLMPFELTDDQRQKIDSWQTLLDTSEALGIDVPSTPPVIQEIFELQKRHEQTILTMSSAIIDSTVEIDGETDDEEPETVVTTLDVHTTLEEPEELSYPTLPDREEIARDDHKRYGLSDELFECLFGSGKLTKSLKNQLTPGNFSGLLMYILDQDKEEIGNAAIARFVSDLSIEFIDAEIDLSPIGARVDIEFSKFLEDIIQPDGLAMLSEYDYLQLIQIYNHSNMLAFARDIYSRFDEISEDHMYMIFRYRTVIKLLEEVGIAFADSHNKEDNVKRVGYRTWAGDVHPYCHETGVVDLREYKDFVGENGND